jgi:hypothetical protein
MNWGDVLKWFGAKGAKGDEDYKSGYGGLFAALLGLGGGYGSYKLAKEAADEAGRGGPPTTGYQGGIPDYTTYRQTVPTYDPNRRPGSSGRRYFTDTEFIKTPPYNYISPDLPNQAEGQTDEAYDQQIADLRAAAQETARSEQQAGLNALLQGAGERADTQKWQSVAQNIGNPAKQAPYSNVGAAAEPVEDSGTTTAPYAHDDIYKVLDKLIGGSQPAPYAPRPPPNYAVGPAQPPLISGFAKGGLMGMYLGGPTDGMGDNIPARIAGGQEARLSDGEFVLPADVVSHLGNGNSDAGAKVLHGMMNKIRKARTGTTQQGKRINPNKLIPR